MEINPAGVSPLDGARSTNSLNTLTSDFDTFLTLLTTQLQNQDPLDPMDSNDFTSQLVQFSAVEQAIATNRNLEQLIALSNAERLTSAVGFMGHNVTARGDTTTLKDGVAAWQYQQDQLMKSVSLLVSDSTGKIVFVADGKPSPGTHEFVWDGKDNAGVQLPEGEYSLSAAATSIGGDAITPTIFVSGRVTGVETVGGDPVLTVNGTQIPLSDVRSILEADRAAAES